MDEELNQPEPRLAERVRELEATVARLERANADLEHFAYAASHDLQAPIRTIGSYTDLLLETLDGPLDETQELSARFLREASQTLKRMVEDLLQFSRVRTKAQPPTRCELDPLLDDVLASLIEQRGAAVVRRPSPLPVVQADRAQLFQLYQHLLDNAFKFHRPDAAPQVSIEAERRDADWLLTITDDGIGVDPSKAERVFEVFQRLHTREAYPGTGIGLAIAKRIVERHGGEIAIEPNQPHGCRVRFTLPVEPEDRT